MKMDDFTINKILFSNKVTKDSFIGVFSSNTLPSYAQTGYYVVNLDMSQQPGSHWMAIKISKSKCKNEYFDSYGLGPPTVHFKRFMKYNYIYNSKRLQHSLSTTCAQWCIYYIWRKCQGWSLRNILKPFYSVRCSLTVHCSVTPFVIQQPIPRPRLLERVYRPMHTSH